VVAGACVRRPPAPGLSYSGRREPVGRDTASSQPSPRRGPWGRVRTEFWTSPWPTTSPPRNRISSRSRARHGWPRPCSRWASPNQGAGEADCRCLSTSRSYHPTAAVSHARRAKGVRLSFPPTPDASAVELRLRDSRNSAIGTGRCFVPQVCQRLGLAIARHPA
jgi:hypothetical protein